MASSSGSSSSIAADSLNRNAAFITQYESSEFRIYVEDGVLKTREWRTSGLFAKAFGQDQQEEITRVLSQTVDYIIDNNIRTAAKGAVEAVCRAADGVITGLGRLANDYKREEKIHNGALAFQRRLQQAVGETREAAEVRVQTVVRSKAHPMKLLTAGKEQFQVDAVITLLNQHYGEELRAYVMDHGFRVHGGDGTQVSRNQLQWMCQLADRCRLLQEEDGREHMEERFQAAVATIEKVGSQLEAAQQRIAELEAALKASQDSIPPAPAVAAPPPPPPAPVPAASSSTPPAPTMGTALRAQIQGFKKESLAVAETQSRRKEEGHGDDMLGTLARAFVGRREAIEGSDSSDSESESDW